MNVAAYSNIVPVKAALWSKEVELVVEDTGHGEWAMRAVEPSNASHKQLVGVRGLSLVALMREYGLASIDILKIDIEGGELDVLSAGSSVLKAVNVLMIETHDRWVPGTTRAMIQATSEFTYEWAQGENHVFCRELWLPEGREPNTFAKIPKPSAQIS
jgi:FkbM family methyltransferase